MIIYKCLISGDEMFSDIYKIIETDNGFFIEVEGKTITRQVGEIDDSLIGGNASAEEVADGTDSQLESGVDIVLNHKLQQLPKYDKKSYQVYIKDYVKAVKTKLQEVSPDRVDSFVKAAPEAVKKLLTMVSKNKDLEYFTGESYNNDATVGILDYREDGITPFMIFMKDGLEIEKC